jgi:hypothetical protein
MDAKKLKMIVRGEKKPTFGTDPNEPWSVRAGITESQKGELHDYLKSRGINPDFVSKDTKISHAKSSEFQKWKRDHQFDDPINYVSTTVADKMKTQRAQTEEVESIDEKNVPTSPEKWARAKAAAKSKFAVYPSAYANGWASKKYKAMGGGWKSVSEAVDKKDTVVLDIPLLIRVLELAREDIKTDMDLHRVVEKLISIRNKGVLTMDDYNTIAKINENHIAIAMGNMLDDEGSMVLSQLEQLERAINMIRSHIGKDYEKQLPAWVQAKITLATDYADTVGNYITSKNEKVTEEVKKPKMTALDKWRKAATEREKRHNDIEKVRQEKLHQDPSKVTIPVADTSKNDMSSAIDRLEKHLNKEDVELKEGEHLPGHPMYKSDPSLYKKTPKSIAKSLATHGAKYFSNTDSGNYRTTDKEAPRYRNEEVEEIDEITQSDLDKSAEQEVAHAKKNGWKVQKQTYGRTYTHPKHGHIDMNRYGEWQHRPASGISRGKGNLIAHGEFKDLDKHISSLKEEVEQIDELKKTTVFSWLKKQPVVPEKKPGMSRKDHNQKIKTHNKSWNRALDRLSGYKPTSEDVFQDTQAATQTAFDMGTQADDREPVYSKKKEMSKSARIIKSLYKKHKMVKEDLYDHEKEDKSVASYGKKPKMDKQEVYGDDDNQAAMVLKGGTTLTGQPRDTLEIDPIMRKSVRPDNKISNQKTDK